MIIVVKHIACEGPGLIQKFFDSTEYGLTTVELEKNQCLPEDFSGIEAAISLGGPMNVYEERKYPFLKEEDRWLKELLRRQIPFLGICLGAQLLAKATGAAVTKAPQKEVGWFNVKLTQEGRRDPIFAGLPPVLSVFQWHEDMFEIPKGGELLASSAACHNQAFRIGKNAYGFQFHLEVAADMIREWTAEYKPPARTAKSMVAIAYIRQDELWKKVQCLLLNFTKIIQAAHRGAAV